MIIWLSETRNPINKQRLKWIYEEVRCSENWNSQVIETYSNGGKYVWELKDDKKLVKEHPLYMMEESMLENLWMDYHMVKENSLILMVDGMMEIGKKDTVRPE